MCKVFGVVDVLEVVGTSLLEGFQCTVDDPSLAHMTGVSYFLHEDLTQLAHECELAQKSVAMDRSGTGKSESLDSAREP